MCSHRDPSAQLNYSASRLTVRHCRWILKSSGKKLHLITISKMIENTCQISLHFHIIACLFRLRNTSLRLLSKVVSRKFLKSSNLGAVMILGCHTTKCRKRYDELHFTIPTILSFVNIDYIKTYLLFPSYFILLIYLRIKPSNLNKCNVKFYFQFYFQDSVNTFFKTQNIFC